MDIFTQTVLTPPQAGNHCFSVLLVFCCMWILFNLWKVQMMILRFYETKVTDRWAKNIMSHWEEMEVIATASANFEDRLSAQFVWNIGVSTSSDGCVCSNWVHLHIEQEWKITNIHVCAVQLTQPRPAWLTLNFLDQKHFIWDFLKFFSKLLGIKICKNTIL